jgi:hypothetical protein
MRYARKGNMDESPSNRYIIQSTIVRFYVWLCFYAGMIEKYLHPAGDVLVNRAKLVLPVVPKKKKLAFRDAPPKIRCGQAE